MAIKSLIYLGAADEAADRFPWLARSPSCSGSNLKQTLGTVALVPFTDFACAWAPVTEVLAITLPARYEAQVLDIASSDLTAFNCQSADLLISRTMLGLEASSVTVQFSALRLAPHFPAEQHMLLFVAVSSGGKLAVVAHEQTEHEIESLAIGLQACFMGSGVNYKPYRIWPEDVLAECAGLEDVPDERTVECVFAPKG